MKKSKLEMINFAPGLFKFNLTVTGEFNFCFQFYTVGTPNKGTPNKEIFPYLTQNLENGKQGNFEHSLI